MGYSKYKKYFKYSKYRVQTTTEDILDIPTENLLQCIEGGIEQIHDGSFVLKDSVGKVDIVPQEGNCYLFNGAAYVNTGVTAPLTGSIEVDFIMLDVTTVQVLFGAYDTDLAETTRLYLSVINSGKISAGVGSHSLSVIFGTTTLIVGQKYTAKLEWDGTTVTLSLDGEPEYTGSQAGTITARDLYIGGANATKTGAVGNQMIGYLSNAKVRNSSNKLLHSWHCDETAGTACLDAVGTAHGTINTATPESFHTKDIRFKSYQNELGYSVLDGAHTVEMDYIANVLYPIALDEDGNSTDLDIYDNTPTYLGVTKNNLIVGGSNCIELDGTAYIATTLNPITHIGDMQPFTFETRIKGYTSNGSLFGGTDLDSDYFFSRVQDLSGDNAKIRIGLGDNLPVSTVTYNVTEWQTIKIDYKGGSTVDLYIEDMDEPAEVLTGYGGGSYPDCVITLLKRGSDEFGGLVDYVKLTTPNKTYTYPFNEGEGVIVHDTTPAVTEETIILNGGFETSAEDWISYLDKVGAEVVDHGGEHCAKLSNLGNAAGTLYQTAEAISGNNYRVRAKIHSGSATVYLRVGSYARGGDLTNQISSGGEWIEIDEIITATTNLLSVGCYINSGTAGRNAYVADILIEPIFAPINGTLENSPTWTTDDGATPSNMMNGFNFDGTIKIPAQTGNTGLDVLGNTLSNPAYKSGEGHNNAENYFMQYPTPTLYQADELLSTNIMFDHTTRLPIPILYSGKEYDYNSDHVMFSNAEDLAWRNFIVYSLQQVEPALSKIYKAIKKPEGA